MRVFVPLRKALGINIGDEVVLRMEDDHQHARVSRRRPYPLRNPVGPRGLEPPTSSI